jgi:hypothetical protein
MSLRYAKCSRWLAPNLPEKVTFVAWLEASLSEKGAPPYRRLKVGARPGRYEHRSVDGVRVAVRVLPGTAPAAGGSVNSDDGERWESEGEVLARGDEAAR